MKRTKGFFRRFGISLLCAWLLIVAVSSATFASTTQQTVVRTGSCPILGTGSTDASAQGTVSLLQKKLQDAGENVGTFCPNHNGIDGIFGPVTHAALISYQGKHGLGADGIVGALTWEALGGCDASSWPDLSPPTGTP